MYKRYFGFFDAIGRKLDGAWSFETADAGYVLLDGLALKEEARSLGRYLMEDFAHYVSKRKRADRRVLLIVDEFSAISRGGADAANLFERVRSYGAGVIVTSQSYEGLGLDAARLVGAAWATIAFQCTDPEPIAARAGTVKEVQTSLRTEYAALPGRNPLLSAKEHMTGTSTEHQTEVPRLASERDQKPGHWRVLHRHQRGLSSRPCRAAPAAPGSRSGVGTRQNRTIISARTSWSAPANSRAVACGSCPSSRGYRT